MTYKTGSNKTNLMIGGNVTKLRNAIANTVIVFIMIVCVSAVFAVFVHSVIYMPAWTSIILGSLFLLFMTMVALEYSEENKND